MTKTEIIQKVANIHNTAAQISVSGDGAIAMGGVLIELRQLAKDLQQDAEREESVET